MAVLMSDSIIAIPPADLILDQMDYRRWAFSDFAEKMTISFADSSKLLNGDLELTPEIAAQLEKVFNIPVHVWLGYEKDYREEIEKINAENAAADAKRGMLQMAIA